MSRHFHQAGMHLAANIKPCLLTTHPRYDEAKSLGVFIRAAERDEPEVSMFWGGPGSYVDFTIPAGYDWWKRQVKEWLLVYGIDATWNDNNEYEIWDDAARCDGLGNPLTIGAVRPLMPLLMTHATASFIRALQFTRGTWMAP
jgi:alpha-glucosidase